MNYFALLGAVAPVFLILAAGYLLRRLNWLTPEADRSLLLVGVNFLYPCLIADTILGNPILAKLGNVVVPPLVGFGTVVLGFVVCAIVGKILRLPPQLRVRLLSLEAYTITAISRFRWFRHSTTGTRLACSSRITLV